MNILENNRNRGTENRGDRSHNTTSEWRARYARWSKWTNLLCVPTSILRRNDWLWQYRGECELFSFRHETQPITKHNCFVLISVPDWMVPLCMCWINHQTEGQMVLSEMFTGSQEKINKMTLAPFKSINRILFYFASQQTHNTQFRFAIF